MAKKMNNMDGILALSHKEITEELEKSRVALITIRMSLAARQSQKSSELQDLRKKIARLKSRESMLKLEAVSSKPTSQS